LIYGWLVSAALAVIFYVVFGLLGLAFFVFQSAVAWCILHVINYIQHYGLIRHRLGPGEYEHPTPAHAWNSNYWLTNIILLHLPRHPDHHIHSKRSFQALRHIDESPQTPFGYAGMFILALLPPLWFKVMNPRVLECHHAT
jgi:alkane 1-monooxygenase